MKSQHILWIIILMILNGNVWAYGGGSSSSTKACNKPKFSEYSPANNTVVAEKSAFSFFASSSTYPESIKVSIKDHAVPITITPKNSGFQVTGVLPELPKGSYSRINITAEGLNKCKGSGGWLVKVSE
jgi:hypothetical protein